MHLYWYQLLLKQNDMKKLILSVAFMIGIAHFAGAQTTSGGQGSRNTTTSGSGKKANALKKNTAAKTDTLNNRVEYKSKGTKQVATPTGQEATGTNGTHSNNPKNASKTDE